MCDSSNYFYYSRRIIRKLKSSVNLLEETVNVLEETLEEVTFFEESTLEPINQLVAMWKRHVDSFRQNIHSYESILGDISSQHVYYEVYASLGSYDGQVVQYVQIVQDYCSRVLMTALEGSSYQLLTALEGAVDRFRRLVQYLQEVLANNSADLSTEKKAEYRQLGEYLDDDIHSWEGEIEDYLAYLEQNIFSIDDFSEINQDIMRAIARVQNLTTQVQFICRNLLEFT